MKKKKCANREGNAICGYFPQNNPDIGMNTSLFWSVQKTSNLGDILTQAVYTSNQLSEF